MGLIIAGVLAIVAYVFYTNIRIYQVYIPLVDAANNIKLYTTEAHLVVEEIIGGDTGEDGGTIWSDLDAADNFAEAMLHGGKVNGRYYSALQDSEMQQQIEDVQDELESFRQMTHQRLMMFDSAGSGTTIDEEYDVLFTQFKEKSDGVIARLREVMAQDFRTFQGMVIALVVVVMIAFVIAGVAFHRYARRINDDVIAISERERRLTLFGSLVDNAADAIALLDQEGNITYANNAFAEMHGYLSERAVLGRHLTSFIAPEQRDEITPDQREAQQKIAYTDGLQIEMRHARADGSSFIGQENIFPIHDSNGELIALGAILRDVTEQREIEEEQQKLQQQVISAQEAALQELSTPIIPIWEDVLVMTLIGSIDTARAQQMIQTLLNAIEERGVKYAIVDVTGVPIVDTRVAQYLIQVAQATELLGARSILVGIRPEVAEAIVSLGVRLDIETRSNLQAGLEYALRRMGRAIREV
jgi:PAS domain S-box-containing protein